MNLQDLINKHGLKKVNSLTKYPSIQTYHELDKEGGRGLLKDNLTDNLGFDSNELCDITEKVDGTNSRIVICGNDYLIGGREEFLTARFDRIFNPANQVVETVKPIADEIVMKVGDDKDHLYVFFGETYGGKVSSGSSNYTEDKTLTDYRVFDILMISVEEADKILSRPIADISIWRDRGEQPYVKTKYLDALCSLFGLKQVHRWSCDLSDIPTDLEGTYDWLGKFLETQVSINGTGKGKSEGVIVKTLDRSFIRKIRFEDYEKTFRKKNQKPRKTK